jgi:hypothetical protein
LALTLTDKRKDAGIRHPFIDDRQGIAETCDRWAWRYLKEDEKEARLLDNTRIIASG